MRHHVPLIILLIFFSSELFPQVAVNTDGSSAATSAIVDIKSDSKGFLPPRISKAKRDSIENPAEGLVVYDTTLKTLDFFNGSKWISIGKGGVYSQDTSLFQITFGYSGGYGNSDETFNDIIYTPDKGFAMTGSTNLMSLSNGGNKKDMLFVKLDEKGQFDVYGYPYFINYIGDDATGTALINSNESGYMMALNSNNDNGEQTVFYYRTTASREYNSALGGSKEYQSNDKIAVYDVVQSNTGYYFFAGQADTTDGENYPDAAIFRLDSAGNRSGALHYFGRSSDDCFRKIIETEDGNLLAAGYSYYSDGSASDILVVKIDTSGNLVSSFAQNGIFLWGNNGKYNIAVAAVETSDNGYIIAGETNSGNSGNYEGLFIKLQQNGSPDKNFGTGGVLTVGGTDNLNINDIIRTKDGNYVAAGYYYSEFFGSYFGDMYAVKITPFGELYQGFGYNGSGAVCIGGSADDQAKAVIETGDGSLVMAGYTKSFGNGGSDAFIVKLDVTGNACANMKTAAVTTGSLTGSVITPSLTEGNYYISEYSGGDYKYLIEMNMIRICH